MNLDHDFVQVSKLGEDHKKKVFTKNGTLFFPKFGRRPRRSSPKKKHFFPPNSSGRLHSDAHQSQIIWGRGDADVNHSVLKLLGRIQPNYWGRYIKARSQKFAMGGLLWGSGGGAPSRRRPMGVWGRSPQPPEAGGLGAKPPAAGGTGVWERSPQRSKILRFFAK